MSAALIRFHGVSKRYGDGIRVVWALRDFDLEVQTGEFVSIIGPSGSGKSTALNMIAGLDVPTTGSVEVDGHQVATLGSRELARFRRRTVAVVFQSYNLLPTLTARENVMVPLQADGLGRREVEARVDRRLAAVGMAARADHYPHELSGGEMQRIAIARALATEASIIVADEPTGNLDSARSEEILELLKCASEREQRTVVLVTHDLRAAAYGDRIISLRDGRGIRPMEDAKPPHLRPVRR